MVIAIIHFLLKNYQPTQLRKFQNSCAVIFTPARRLIYESVFFSWNFTLMRNFVKQYIVLVTRSSLSCQSIKKIREGADGFMLSVVIIWAPFIIQATNTKSQAVKVIQI